MAIHLFCLITSDLRFFEILMRSNIATAQQAQQPTEASNDYGAAKYLLGESPKLRYACRQIYNALWGEAEKGPKLTIYVNWPLSPWHLICFLTLLGIDHHTTWPGTSGAEKYRVYGKFNDKDDPVKILVVNLRSSAWA
ncbi:hypothetical protein LTS15_010765 [Exophiala xenobiotica]|nr:hypothetical protein LTS15_010765 [Exophiala xenobiotica]